MPPCWNFLAAAADYNKARQADKPSFPRSAWERTSGTLRVPSRWMVRWLTRLPYPSQRPKHPTTQPSLTDDSRLGAALQGSVTVFQQAQVEQLLFQLLHARFGQRQGGFLDEQIGEFLPGQVQSLINPFRAHLRAH